MYDIPNKNIQFLIAMNCFIFKDLEVNKTNCLQKDIHFLSPIPFLRWAYRSCGV